MGRHVFLRIVDAVSNFDPYLQQRIDAVGRKYLSPLQKCTAAMRMLAYGVSGDVVDDYVRIGESTAVEGLKKFVSNVITIFEGEYLQKPNSNDMQRLLPIGEARGFPDRSPVFDDILQGRAPEVNYTTNGNNYNMGYYLTDEIYSEWATFVKTIPRPQDERDTYATQFGSFPTYDDATNGLSQPNLGEEPSIPYETYIQNSMQMRDRRAHRQLQNDLVEHISQFNENR
ncbi:uncharacterized protein LOC141691143 [Apium graveolens]|uniref:uncharacterized protein LOC141691143 n=1 Tax=Apium graveolens TaxID=4045 RepID=UPI003D7A9D7D